MRKITIRTFLICLKFTVIFVSNLYCEQEAVLILGMHRSGTSATTGVLQILGLNLGSDLIEGHFDNVKGHFEDVLTVKLNQKILKELLFSSWNDIKPLKLDSDKAEKELIKSLIKDNLKRFTDEGDNFGLKDPRLCILLPFYLDVLRELEYKPKLIIVLRDPLEVAKSLEKRDGMSIQNALALTEKYLKAIKDYSEGYEKLYIQFNDLIFSNDQLLKRFKSFLHDLDSSPEVVARVKSFLDKDLKHQQASDSHSTMPIYQELLEDYYEQLFMERS